MCEMLPAYWRGLLGEVPRIFLLSTPVYKLYGNGRREEA
jgi:hypothetical protein